MLRIPRQLLPSGDITIIASKNIPVREMSFTPYLVRKTIPAGAPCDPQILKVLPFQGGKEVPLNRRDELSHLRALEYLFR